MKNIIYITLLSASLVACSNSSSKDTTAPDITILGENPVNILKGTSYSDAGATADDNKDGAVTVSSSGQVDTAIVANYSIVYTAKDKAGNKATATRIVIVKEGSDTDQFSFEKAMLANTQLQKNQSVYFDFTLKKNDSNFDQVQLFSYISATKKIKDSDFEITEYGIDEHDFKNNLFSLDSYIKITPEKIGDYYAGICARKIWKDQKVIKNINICSNPIKITVKDSVEGKDITPPVISILGEKEVTVQQGSTYTDAGATAVDDVDGSVEVDVWGDIDNIDTSKVGKYFIFYTAKDKAGNKTTVERSVTIARKAVESISIVPSSIHLKMDEKLELKLLLTYKDNTEEEISGTSSKWIIGDSSIVEAIGEVKTDPVAHKTVVLHALKEGKTTLTATFNSISSTPIEIIVSSISNQVPIANAGNDQSIEEGKKVTLSGNGTDSDGSISNYLWKEGEREIGQQALLELEGLSVGIHTFSLTVTDNQGAENTDEVQITITEKSSLDHIGSWGDGGSHPIISDFVIKGDYAYVLQREGTKAAEFVILDISDKSAIHKVGSLGELYGLNGKIELYGNYAFVGGANISSSIFYIIDLTDLEKPKLFDSISQLGGINDLSIYGNYLYLATKYHGLLVLDVSSLSESKDDNDDNFGSLIEAGDMKSIAIAGNYAYLSGKEKFQVVDISNPTKPILVKTYAISGDGLAIRVSGNYAYIIDDEDGLLVFDISDVNNPTLVRTNDLPNDKITGYGGFEIIDEQLYISSYDGFYILDISNPINIQTLAHYENSNLNDLQIIGNDVYLADIDGGLLVINQSNFNDLYLSASYNIGVDSRQIVTSGDYAYVIDRKNGLLILDISNPATPKLIGVYDNSPSYRRGDPMAIALSGNYIYTYTSNDFFDVIDISNPRNPKKVKRIDNAIDVSNFIEMIAKDNLLIISDDNGGHAYDISTPSAPVLLQNERLNGLGFSFDNDKIYSSNSIYDSSLGLISRYYVLSSYTTINYSAVDSLNNILYMLSDKGKLFSIDISDSKAPKLLGTKSLDESTNSLQLIGNQIYVTDKYGLVIFNTNTPANPSIIKSYDTKGNAQDTVIDGQYIYIADGKDGIKVIKQ